MGFKPPAICDATLGALTAYSFPGNIRELKNIIERALIESGGGPIKPQHIRLPSWSAGMGPTPAKAVEVAVSASVAGEMPLNLEAAEDFLIRRALSETGGNIAEAARRLGINRTRIYRRLKSV